jgi:hypothetical protein
MPAYADDIPRQWLRLEARKQASIDGASRTRTGDLLGAIQALSQLSYSPGIGRRTIVRHAGVEGYALRISDL